MTPLRPSLQHSALSIQHWLVLLLAVCPYFIDLGGSSIWDANEAFYVETPREMERGDYVNPMFNYEPRVNKPVLSYWIVAGFYHLFGVSAGVQRVPIALGGMVLIVTAFFLARAAAPQGEGGRGMVVCARACRVAAFADVRPSHLHRHLHFDVHGADAPVFRALGAVLKTPFVSDPDVCVCVGLGVLTKGPIAALLPGLVFAIYLVVHRELGRARDMLLPLGTVIVLAIVVPCTPPSISSGGGARSSPSSSVKSRSLRGRRRRQRRPAGLVVHSRSSSATRSRGRSFSFPRQRSGSANDARR